MAAAAGLTCLILFGAVRNLLYTYRAREVSAAPKRANLLYHHASFFAPNLTASFQQSLLDESLGIVELSSL